MIRDELINKIMACLDCEECSKCKYEYCCGDLYKLLSDIYVYLVSERDAEVEETKRLIERIINSRKG